MSFFSEERSSELRDLFFESAAELLQTLNEEGLLLEQRPGDAEVVREVRRTVHTLKGDSAACGYQELSSLAHELEDALTPELAERRNTRIAEVVLSAADAFQMMLNAYRGNTTPPSGESVRRSIHELLKAPTNGSSIPKVVERATGFQWSEYEQMVMADATRRGLKVLQVSLTLDANCMVRAAALQMAKMALQDLGNLLVIVPDENMGMQDFDVIQAGLASSFDKEYIAKKCHIPAVVSDVLVEPYAEIAAHEAVCEAPQSPVAEPAAEALGQPTAEVTAVQRMAAEPLDPADSIGSSAPEAAKLRVDAEKIDAVLNLVGELIIGKSMLTQTISEFDKRFTKDPLRAKFADALAFQARVLNDLQKSVMKVRMVPVEQLFRRFPRIVRDVSKSCGKEVGLEISGQNTDLDKSILDVLAEPLAHLVRNAISHGIESPAERAAIGKPAQGTVELDAYHQGNHIVIEVRDDGRGIDRLKVVAKAIETNVITADDANRLTDGEALNLIFHPGLSTAEEVTAVSGRGVGMDVVKSVVERLKGSVSIETKVGEGTRFFVKVPLTLAIIKALLFRVQQRLYAVPLGSVVEITRAQQTEIHRVDQHEVLRLRDEVLTLVRLNKLNREAGTSGKKIFVVVIAIGDRKFGLVVDKLIGEEELVIKALDDHLVATDYVSGASILGDGTVVLILNINAVVAKLGRNDGRSDRATGASA
ncbi:MAG TPA: chemotaxis protein CheA [Terriglobales bacterium]|nr:chemotaxis protein CheA [Terriglobales bacterium]